MKYMRLAPTAFDDSMTQEEFRSRWSEFLRSNDVLVVYHQRTFELIRRVNAVQPSCLVLKSIFGKWQNDFHSIEELMNVEGLRSPVLPSASRAEYRLDMAIALVEHLQAKYSSRQPLVAEGDPRNVCFANDD